jgi:hypothetical protein
MSVTSSTIESKAANIAFSILNKSIAANNGSEMTREVAKGYAVGAIAWLEIYCGPEVAAEFTYQIADALACRAASKVTPR